MKKNKITLILIFSIIATTLSVGLFVFFFKIIENKNQHISVVLTTLGEKEKEKEDAIIFSEKVVEIETLNNSINSHFVYSNKIDTFVNYLEEIGSGIGSGVSVKSIEKSVKIKNTIIFKLSIIGTFQEVMKTIILLENIPYQVNISQVYLNKNSIKATGNDDVSDKTNGVTNWQADISFNILSLN